MPQRIRAGCDTAAVVTYTAEQALLQRIRAGCDFVMLLLVCSVNPLPQRIRAGCDCGKAMQRTANLLREGR